MLKAKIYAMIGAALVFGGCASSSGYTQSNVGDVKASKDQSAVDGDCEVKRGGGG